MKKFKFNQQSLLRYREYLEHLAKINTARAVQDVHACERSIEKATSDRVDTADRLENEVSSGIGVNRYKWYTTYLQGVEALLESENNRLGSLSEILEEKRRVLAQKAIDKKMMESLEEKRRDEYYDELRKSLQKESDDIILVRKDRDLNK